MFFNVVVTGAEQGFRAHWLAGFPVPVTATPAARKVLNRNRDWPLARMADSMVEARAARRWLVHVQ